MAKIVQQVLLHWFPKLNLAQNILELNWLYSASVRYHLNKKTFALRTHLRTSGLIGYFHLSKLSFEKCSNTKMTLGLRSLTSAICQMPGDNRRVIGIYIILWEGVCVCWKWEVYVSYFPLNLSKFSKLWQAILNLYPDWLQLCLFSPVVVTSQKAATVIIKVKHTGTCILHWTLAFGPTMS